MPDRNENDGFDESEIREAERRLEIALASPDCTTWVYEYTEDAVFDGGQPVVGRAALLQMAQDMAPLSSVSIRALRTEGSANLAIGWYEASWVSGLADTGSAVEVRGMILWRRDVDGIWRVALEHIS